MILTFPNHVHIKDESRPDDVIKWVSQQDVPKVGDRVKVLFNGFGQGEVIGYEVNEGYLSIVVKIDKLPAWYVRQYKGDVKDSIAVYGSEFIPV